MRISPLLGWHLQGYVALGERAAVADEGIEAARALRVGQFGLAAAGLLAASIVNNIGRHQRLRLQSVAVSSG